MGRLVRRSAHAPDRPALFAAQFAPSHACWLITYPLAGWVGARAGQNVSFLALAALGALAAVLGSRLWPRAEPAEIEHGHHDLEPAHPHLQDTPTTGPSQHAHEYVIDDEHRSWPP